jgi:hypothetical protein
MTVRELPVLLRLEDILQLAEPDRNGNLLRTYDVPMVAGRRYYIDMESGEFATYMRLLDSAGIVVAVDEGGPGSMNTRIAFEAPSTGIYRIVATSFEPNITGAYALTVREEG